MRAWLVVAVLLSGCMGGDGTPPADDVPADGSGSTGEPAPGNVTVPEEVLSSIAVDWSGRTKEGAWVCADQSGTGQCPAGQQVAPDGEHVTTVPYDGNLTLVDVNMT